MDKKMSGCERLKEKQGENGRPAFRQETVRRKRRTLNNDIEGGSGIAFGGKKRTPKICQQEARN